MAVMLLICSSVKQMLRKKRQGQNNFKHYENVSKLEMPSLNKRTVQLK